DVSHDGHTVRVWILVSDDDDADTITDRAVELGAEELWRHHYWKEFNGFSNAFKDPWGNTLVLWTKGGDNPQIPEGWTGEGAGVHRTSADPALDAHRPPRQRHRRLDRVVPRVHAARTARPALRRVRARCLAGPARLAPQTVHPRARLALPLFSPETAPLKGSPQGGLAPFPPLGIELTSHDAIDEIAAKAESAGCL